MIRYLVVAALLLPMASLAQPFRAASPVQEQGAAREAPYQAPNKTFEFQQSKFSRTFPLHPSPMEIEADPGAPNEDTVRFIAGRAMYPYIFEVTAFPTTDGTARLEKMQKDAKSSPGVRQAELLSPCAFDTVQSSCLRIRDVAFKDDLPVFVRDAVGFVANGRVYVVSASNFAPSVNIHSKDDLRDFHEDGSFNMAELALETFLGSFRVLP